MQAGQVLVLPRAPAPTASPSLECHKDMGPVGGQSSCPHPVLCSCRNGVLQLQVSDSLERAITMVTAIIMENCCHYYRGRVKTNRNYQFLCF